MTPPPQVAVRTVTWSGCSAVARTASVDVARHACARTGRCGTLEWWVGADDRWHLARREAAVRQTLVDDMPVVRTAMRVPGGDAVHEVFGATADAVVVDVENASPAPFVVAFVVVGARRWSMLDDSTVLVDGVPALTALRPPSRWASATDGTLAEVVTRGDAVDGPMPVVRDRGAPRRGRLPLPGRAPHAPPGRRRARPPRHGRAARPRPHRGPGRRRRWRGGGVPSSTVACGSRCPTPRLQAAVDDGTGAGAPRGPGVAGRARRGGRARGLGLRRRGGRGVEPARAARPSTRAQAAPGRRARRGRPARLLGAAAAAPRRRRSRRPPARAPARAAPTRGAARPSTCATVPTRLGPVSYSVRWHGERAALLWELPPGAQRPRRASIPRGRRPAARRNAARAARVSR